MRSTLLCAALLFAASQISARAVFTAGPTVTTHSDSVTIAFTVSEYTDCAVEILDSAGKIVRHLAAGKLGPVPPAPLAAGSLSQSLTWDKKNDLGAAITGSWKVRVGLGLKAKFDRFYGFSPDNEIIHSVGGIKGLGVDPDGNLIIRTGCYRGDSRMFLFSSTTGKYLKTLSQYPSDQPYDKMKGFGLIPYSDGVSRPVVFSGHYGQVLCEFTGPTRHNIAVTVDSHMVLPNAATQYFYSWGLGGEARYRRAIVMGLDGSCPNKSLFGPQFTSGSNIEALFVAVSPDGKWVYSSQEDCVRRGRINDTAMAPIFLGADKTPGNDSVHFSDCRGLATDPDGRLYVADYGNLRFMVYDSNGVFLKRKPLSFTDQIAVHPVTGAVYVTVQQGTVLKFVKYSAYPALDSLYSITLGLSGSSNYLTATVLNPKPVKPQIWYSAGGSYLSGVEDNGTAFTTLTTRVGQSTGTALAATSALEAPGYFAVDPDEKVLYQGCATWKKINLATGAISASTVKGYDLCFGPDGNIYTWGSGGANIKKYSQAEAALTFGTKAMITAPFSNDFYGPEIGSRGLHVDARGNIHVIVANRSGTYKGAYLMIYRPDGTLRDSALIAQSLERGNCGGIGTDLQGNLFTTFNGRPRGAKYPEGYLASPFLPDPNQTHYLWNFAAINHYAHHIGALFKFPPTGGTIKYLGLLAHTVPPDSTVGFRVPLYQVDAFYRCKWEIKGPAWQYFGPSPVPNAEPNGGDAFCHCMSCRFSVDGHGRVFLPEAMRFSVAVLDNNKNSLARIGDYGNADQMGEGSSRPYPAIPLGYPMFVQKVNDHLYVADQANHRIVRADLVYDWTWTSDGGLIDLAEAARPTLKGPLAISALPRPFSASVALRMRAPAKAALTLRICDASGRVILTRSLSASPAGLANAVWDGRDAQGRPVAAGLYMAEITAGGRKAVERLVLAR